MRNYQSYINLGFQSGMRLLSQYLNFKCGEGEFKNPLMNGLQIAVKMASAQTIYDFNTEGNAKVLSTPDILKKICLPIIFGCAMTADDLLMKEGWTEKHHLTNVASVFGTADLIKNFDLSIADSTNKKNPLGYQTSLGIGVALFAIKYIQEHLTGSKGYIDTTRALQIKLSNNIKNFEYVTDGVVNMQSTVATQVLINEGIDLISPVITATLNHVDMANANIELQRIQQLQSVLKLISNILITSSIAHEGLSKIHEKNNKIISSPHSLLKISSNDEYSSTLNRIDQISSEVSHFSSDILMTNSFLLGAENLTKDFPLLNLRSSLGEMFQASNTTEIHKTLNDCLSYMNKFKSSLVSNPRTIIERSGLDYFVNKNQDMQKEIADLHNSLKQKDESTTPIFLASLVDASIAGGLSMDIGIFMNIFNLVNSVQSLPQTEALTPSLERLTELYKFLETIENTSYVEYKSHNGKNLNLKDINIDIEGVKKFHLDEMTLEAGKWYLLTGKSGCGKTTFMSTLRGLPNFTESIEIRGEVYYPKSTAQSESKIYMLTQTNNFPYGVKMIESICYPMVTTELERQSYKPLVEELMLKMEGFSRGSAEGYEYLESGLLSRLDEGINDVTSETSGGQQKKMSITGMIVRIMKETGMLNIYNEEISSGKSHDAAIAKATNSVGPVLVLIDETFNGLDSGANGGTFARSSKGLVLQTLKESLPRDAIVVSVEHQPQIDQYDGRIHLNGDGSYTYTGHKTQTIIPSDSEAFDPLKAILGDIVDL